MDYLATTLLIAFLLYAVASRPYLSNTLIGFIIFVCICSSNCYGILIKNLAIISSRGLNHHHRSAVLIAALLDCGFPYLFIKRYYPSARPFVYGIGYCAFIMATTRPFFNVFNNNIRILAAFNAISNPTETARTYLTLALGSVETAASVISSLLIYFTIATTVHWVNQQREGKRHYKSGKEVYAVGCVALLLACHAFAEADDPTDIVKNMAVVVVLLGMAGVAVILGGDLYTEKLCDFTYVDGLTAKDPGEEILRCEKDTAGDYKFIGDEPYRPAYWYIAIASGLTIVHPYLCVTLVPAAYFSLETTKKANVVSPLSPKESPEAQARTKQLDDGVYCIYVQGFFGKRQKGMGCVYKGTYHTLYHVTHGARLIIDGEYLDVHAADDERDTICYQGPWRITSADPGTLQVIAQEPGGRIKNYAVNPSKCVVETRTGTTEKLVFGLDLASGSSGSPIINGKKEVVGLYGYGFFTSRVDGGYASMVTNDSPEDNSSVKPLDFPTNFGKIGKEDWVEAHPGAGKTRRLGLRMIQEALDTTTNMYYLCPTRTVCEEVRKVLGNTQGVSCNFKGGKATNTRVVITCHATFVKMILTRQLPNTPRIVVMDEAHWLDANSIAARGWMHFNAKAGLIYACYMTATPPNHTGKCGSNYPIDEEPVPEAALKDVKATVQWLKTLEGKGVVFVASKKDTRDFRRDYGVGAVQLSRDDFSTNYPKAAAPETKVVFATEIAEMGANLSVDYVVDIRRKVAPVVEGDAVVLRHVDVTPASVNQRRGRVGRQRPGTYYYTGTTCADTGDWVCWLEAEILVDNMMVQDFVEGESRNSAPGTYYLKDAADRQKFIILVYDKEIPPYLAHEMVACSKHEWEWCITGDDEDVLELAAKSDGTYYTMTKHYVGREFKPTTWDARVMGDSATIPTYLKENLCYKSWNYKDEYLKLITEGWAYLTGALPEKIVEMQGSALAPSALVTIATVTVGVAAALSGFLFLSAFTSVFKALTADHVTFVTSGTAAMGFYLIYVGHDPLAVVGGIISIAIFLVVFVSERGTRRSTPETFLGIIVILCMFLSLVVAANEASLLEKTKADIYRLFNPPKQERNTSVPFYTLWETGYVKQQIWGASDVPWIWGAYCLYMTVCLPYIRHNQQMANNVVGPPSPATETGKIATGMPWLRSSVGKWDILASVGLCLGVPTWTTVFITGVLCALATVVIIQADRGASVMPAIIRKTLATTRNLACYDGNSAINFHTTESVLDNPIQYVLYGGGFFAAAFCFYHYADYRTFTSAILLACGCGASLIGHTERIFSPTILMGAASLMNKRYWAILSLVTLLKGPLSRRSDGAGAGLTHGRLWKKKLNSFTKEEFDGYRERGITRSLKLDALSRGGHKLSWFISRGYVSPMGSVIDYGCGAGGWCQRVACEERVTDVRGFTLGGETRENPQVPETTGYNLINYKVGVDVYTRPLEKCDTFFCDIGESDPSYEVETSRTVRILKKCQEWFASGKPTVWCVKVLCPYEQETRDTLRNLIKKYGGSLVRNAHSRNSSHEMYWVSHGHDKNVEPAISRTSICLLNRMTGKPRNVRWETEYKYGKGVRTPPRDSVPDIKEAMYKRRLGLIKKHKREFKVEAQNPYRTWKYLGTYEQNRSNHGGQATNGVMSAIMWPWNKIAAVHDIRLTDVTTKGIERLFREKIDTKAPEPTEEVKNIGRIIMDWTLETVLKRVKIRICTKEEFIARVKSTAAVGGFVEQLHWKSAVEAVNDPQFWKEVDMERELHLKGECERCVYNLMAKREKKESRFNQPKSSRLIWYLWLGARFLEYEALGFLNEEHVISRENSYAGVGGDGLQYLGYRLKEAKGTRSKGYCEDTASWDTRITRDDLENEAAIADHVKGTHKKLIEAIYRNVYMCKVALAPRSGLGGKDKIDVIVRDDQRGSGEVVTYALNTITNMALQLGRVAESEGIIGPRAQGFDLRYWLEQNGKMELKRMCVAGDDVVVFNDCPEYSQSLWYINARSKQRKNMEKFETSRSITEFAALEFCSHHFHPVLWKQGGKLLVPCRDQNHIVGRWRCQLGKQPDIRESACLAKAYAQMSLLFYFHRRDIRLGAMAVCSSVPVNWVPTGKTTWSVHQNHEWMTNEDMLDVWNRVWIRENPHIIHKVEANCWAEIPYLPKGADYQCSSISGEKDRVAWAANICNTINRVRSYIGAGEEYVNYMRVLRRYATVEVADVSTMHLV